jgi:hypothetical protein
MILGSESHGTHDPIEQCLCHCGAPICNWLGYWRHRSICYTGLFPTPRVVITISPYNEFWPSDILSRGGPWISSPSECWQLTDWLTIHLLTNSVCLSLSYVTTDGQSASLSWYKAPIWGLRPDIFSVRNTEYVWKLRSWFRGAPSLTRGRVCFLYVPLALASAVFLGPSPLGLATVVYCLRFETSLFVASYDSQGHGGGIRPRLHTGVPSAVLKWTLLYNLFARTTQKTQPL